MRLSRKRDLLPLQELHPIAEGVTELQTVVARNRDAFDDGNSQGGAFGFPDREVNDLVSDVGLGGKPVYAILDTEMKLTIPDLKPQPTTPYQAGRFFDLRQAEGLAVEMTSLLLSSCWDGQLDVVNTSNHSFGLHGTPFASPSSRRSLYRAAW